MIKLYSNSTENHNSLLKSGRVEFIRNVLKNDRIVIKNKFKQSALLSDFRENRFKNPFMSIGLTFVWRGFYGFTVV
jgi:hypothetical protein